MTRNTLAHDITRALRGDLSATGGNVPGLNNGPHDRSVSISAHPRDPLDVLVYCHNGADALDFKRHLRAVGLLRPRSGRSRERTVLGVRRTDDRTAIIRVRMDLGRSVWQRASAATDTPVDAYLRSRGIIWPLALWCRFTPSCSRGRDLPALPALIASVTVPTTGEFRAVHRIYLCPDGSGKADLPRDQQKRSLGPTAGAAVVLGDLASTERAILEGEGVETTLSACMALGRPGIATLSASTLGRPPLPAGRAVVILADRGAEAAADKAAHLRLAASRRVWIATPPAGFKDWNDHLRAEGPDAVRAALKQAREVGGR